jgi:hypothetical protein
MASTIGDNEVTWRSAITAPLFNPVAFNQRVIDFVRENNRLAGILRDPSPAEIGAHRGLLAARTLRVENLQMFVRHVETDARLREHDWTGGRQRSYGRRTMYEDLEDLLLRSGEDLWPPELLQQRYMQLRPFTDANGRSGRALWLRQVEQTRTRQRPGLLATKTPRQAATMVH